MWRHEGDSFVTLFALGPLDGTSLVPLWLEFTPILTPWSRTKCQSDL